MFCLQLGGPCTWRPLDFAHPDHATAFIIIFGRLSFHIFFSERVEFGGHGVERWTRPAINQYISRTGGASQSVSVMLSVFS